MTSVRRFTASLVLILSPLAGAAAPAAAAHAALDSLIAAERAFAATSVEKGVREAFLTYLAEDGVIFRPRAVNGREVWQARGPVPATLVWEPAYAEVSAAGDLGYTTGPWELRPYDTKRPVGHGHFVSVWQTQADGRWRVVLDIGVSHERPARGVGSSDFRPGPEHAAARPAAAANVDLLALDRAWADDARALGSTEAFARWTTADVRLYRDGVQPVRGARAARATRPAGPGPGVWDPEAQRIARSGDLGCTYGILERRAGPDAPADSSVYVHVWRRIAGDRWKAALVLENPLPKAEKP
jgi:ketosteroid isomerase-like protein